MSIGTEPNTIEVDLSTVPGAFGIRYGWQGGGSCCAEQVRRPMGVPHQPLLLYLLLLLLLLPLLLLPLPPPPPPPPPLLSL